MKAAEALGDAFKTDYPGFSVNTIDLLDHSSFLARQLYGKAYAQIVRNFPELFAAMYRSAWSSRLTRPRLLFDRLNARPFLDLLDKYQPDAVVATHYIPAALVVDYRKRKGLHFSVFVTITDYEVHPIWMVGDIERYAVAHEEMKHALKLLGVREDAVLLSGIPINPLFAEQKDHEALRGKYGLRKTSPVVLFMIGWNSGQEAVEEIMNSLSIIKEDFQAILVCGKNRKLYERMKQVRTREPRVVLAYEFVDFVDELMRVSDLLVSKPGGITVSESLAIGLPAILVDPIPGQEEANVKYLMENGAALEARGAESLLLNLRDLIARPETIRQMKERIKKIAKPKVASAIARDVAETLSRK